MNYIKEINAFHKQNLFEPLSSSAVCLWFGLMHFNNLCGWKKKFSVAASQLQAVSGLKATAFKEARKELQKKGRIVVTSRGGNQSAVYQMVSQEMVFGQGGAGYIEEGNSVECVPEQYGDSYAGESGEHGAWDMVSAGSGNPGDGYFAGCMDGDNSGHSSNRNRDRKSGHSSGPFFKQDNTEQKSNKTIAAAADAIHFFEANFGGISPFISRSIQEWVAEMGEGLVLHAMELALEQGVAKWRYVKGILEAWRGKGIVSVEQAMMEEKPGQAEKFAQPRDEIVPDWLVERKKEEAERERIKQEELSKRVVDPVEAAREMEEIRELLAGLG